MKRSRVNWFGCRFAWLLLLVGCAPTTQDRIIYVDATDGPAGNTRLASGEEFTAQGSSPLIGNDNLWSKRIKGNVGTVFATNDGQPSGPEDGPGLVTTIGDLEPGERYQVFAYFWADHSDWQLKASLTQFAPPGDDPAVGYSKLGSNMSKQAPDARPANFADDVMLAEENRTLLQADLGEAVADTDGKIRVWIDDKANTGYSNRTWYDGVGVKTLGPKRWGISKEALLIALAIAAVLATLLYVVYSLLRDRRRSPNTP